MVIGGKRQTERAPQQDLPSRRLQQIGSADCFGDSHCSIVDDHCELIGGNIVAPPHDEITELCSGNEALASKMRVIEGDCFTVRHAKAPIHTRGRLISRPIGTGAAGARIKRLVIRIVVRSGRCLRDIPARTRTRIDQAAIPQLAPSLHIEIAAFALRIWPVRSSHIGTFAPFDPEPMQVVEHGFGELGATTLLVEVFVSQNQCAAMLRGPPRGDPERSSMPNMQQPSRGRRKPSPISDIVFTHEPIYPATFPNTHRSAGQIASCVFLVGFVLPQSTGIGMRFWVFLLREDASDHIRRGCLRSLCSIIDSHDRDNPTGIHETCGCRCGQ